VLLTPRILTLLLAALLSVGLLAAGCGDDSDDSEEAAEEAEAAALSPEQAIAEIAVVRKMLDDGLAAYEKGDQAAAEELVTDAYLEHFELVEPPLEEADEELNEELEVLIREELGGAVAAGDPEADVKKLVDEAQSGLDDAEAALGGGHSEAAAG
jgi:alkanesulfonate monooxygenase SsuD/methylene tetrahydromethanopterin reductase-like flavin-dependent oxidoreductase (luciferase family)